MADQTFLTEQYEMTRSTIEKLLDDGSDPDAIYLIEHHISSHDKFALEKAATEAFSLGYEVTDIDEVELDDGNTINGFDIVIESELDPDVIDEQVIKIIDLCEKSQVNYDGWGTYFEDDEDEDEDENSYEDYDEDEYHYDYEDDDDDDETER